MQAGMTTVPGTASLLDGSESWRCSNCNGKGIIVVRAMDGIRCLHRSEYTCHECCGTGRIMKHTTATQF